VRSKSCSPPSPTIRAAHPAGRAGRLLGTFAAPLCASARLLLAEGLQPETELRIRHAGSASVALRSTVAAAAGLSVQEDTADGKARFVKWKPSGNHAADAEGPQKSLQHKVYDEEAA
jgi:hypothetical protein